MIVAYLFTTFPQSTETFLQREIAAMHKRGVNLRVYSLWGGGGEFRGIPIETFNKWGLFRLIWVIPWAAVVHTRVFAEVLRGLLTRSAPSFLNFWENMLGAGFAALFYPAFRRDPPQLIHAAWSGGPATAAWILARINGLVYSTAAHAYDIYEHGGDWWLREKLDGAVFVHTSTQMGRDSLVARGIPAAKIHVIRRGLEMFPPMKALRQGRSPLRILCIARLVEKKGLDRQLFIYAALMASNFPFEARIIGDGPLRSRLEAEVSRLGLRGFVKFFGHLPESAVWEQLAWADVLVHTGVVSASGDRDGLPNVIPEAMSAGVVVVTSPTAATTEAVVNEATGLVASVEALPEWEMALRRVATDDSLAERLRRAARSWAEENFDAHRNAARLHALFEQAASEEWPQKGAEGAKKNPEDLTQRKGRNTEVTESEKK